LFFTESFISARVTDDVKPQFAGHVVAVVERMPGQLFSGTLGLLRPSSAATKEKQEAERREREGDRGDEPRRGPIERPKIVWFKPTDKRVPLIAIPTEQAPVDFVQNSETYANKLFVACIKRHVSVYELLYGDVIDVFIAYQFTPPVRYFG
jgi:protein SSD1